MMRLVNSLMLVLSIGVIGCATQSIGSSAVVVKGDASEVVSDVVDSSESDLVMIGGWAPAFFAEFNKKELQDIVDGINSGRIKRATISYPTQMNSLAVQIRDYLQSQTNSKIKMEKVELANTDMVTYNMKQVVVTLYFSGK